MPRVILASQSPRRQELMSAIAPGFRVVVSQADESLAPGTPPGEAVEELALRKAGAVLASAPAGADWVVIGADTVVSAWGKILGKPADKEDASHMLKDLQGGSHQVYTGVTLAWKYKDMQPMFMTFSECTDVTMYTMSQEEIKRYVDSGEPMDKAGAYAIQGLCAAYIQGICGDYNNVVGLPVGRLCQELKKRGLFPES